MRLLNIHTRQLEEYFGDAIPPYAILSHTWGQDEVIFKDFASDKHRSKHSYAKIDGCCREAARNGLLYAWIDTCCIDKSSSAELSEAINSMFEWYRAASVCYAYLEDVPPGEDPYQFGTAFRKSRWHTRGWTLQELLAPQRIVFFDSTWTNIFGPNAGQDLIEAEATSMNRGEIPYATHHRMAERKLRTALLSGITSISVQVLREEIPLESVSAACKFSWAASRKTTRIEDQAYCLLGLMGVNMPLLYGEGEKAFVRLQEAVLSRSDDISVLAWGYDLSWKVTADATGASILANSPAEFLGYPRGNVHHVRRTPRIHTTMTGHGLHIELLMIRVKKRNNTWLGVIEEHARTASKDNTGVAIVLTQVGGPQSDIFKRAGGCPPVRVFDTKARPTTFPKPAMRMIYLQGDTMTSLRPSEKSSDSLGLGSLYSRLSFERTYHETPTVILSLGEVNQAGFFLSSLYPPIGEGHQLVSKAWEGTYAAGLKTLECHGPRNQIFYAILARDRENRFAVRVAVNWSNDFSYTVALCRMDGDLHGTALEHWTDNKIGWRASKAAKHAIWRDYVNMRSPVTQKPGHVRVVKLSHVVETKGAAQVHSALRWVDWYYEEGGEVL